MTKSDVEGDVDDHQDREPDDHFTINSDLLYKEVLRSLNDLHEQKKIPKEDLPKEHLKSIISKIDELTANEPIPEDLLDVVKEMIKLGPDNIGHERQRRFDHAMNLAKESRGESREIDRTLHDDVRTVLEQAGKEGHNLAFLKHILNHYGYDQTDSILQSLTNGFRLVGKILVESSVAKNPKEISRIEHSQEDIESMAQKITDEAIRSFHSRKTKEDLEIEQEIFQQTKEEIQKGRITKPTKSPRFPRKPKTRRFGVKQISSKGKHKIRCIDDFLRSQINALCEVDGSLRMGKIADLIEVARELAAAFPDEDLVIFKTDFRSAYRCCPIDPQDQEFSEFVFQNPETGEIEFAIHKAMPFGAIAAVYGWDRLAHAITYLIRKILITPAIRYVDDLFGVMFKRDLEKFQSMLLELVTKLGFTLEEEKTPIPSKESVVLGIELKIEENWVRGDRRLFVRARVDPQKSVIWQQQLRQILESGSITQRIAEKIAGRLNFAACSIAGQSGSARINELYKVAFGSKRQVTIDHRLKADLDWWLSFLTKNQSLRYRILGPRPRKVILYTDADGSGGIGSTLITDDIKLFLRGKLDRRCTDLFIKRATQIIPLEAMAVLIAIFTFKKYIGQSELLVMIDNSSVLGAARKGRSSANDVHKIITKISDLCLEFGITKHLFWVPSAMNMADLPSRGGDPVGFVRVKCIQRQIAQSVSVIK